MVAINPAPAEAAASSRSAAVECDFTTPLPIHPERLPNPCRTHAEQPPRTTAERPAFLFGVCSDSAVLKVHLRDMCDRKMTFLASGRARSKNERESQSREIPKMKDSFSLIRCRFRFNIRQFAVEMRFISRTGTAISR